jgi:hypothetical protein
MDCARRGNGLCEEGTKQGMVTEHEIVLSGDGGMRRGMRIRNCDRT